MAAPGHHDASSCSTAASEQSDRRKRPSPSCDDDANFKPYECRFCTMKFAKSQALGGHMNRHRQEREREQVDNARQLLMQQEHLPRLMMSGPNSPTTLSKLTHAHLPRSATAESGALKDGIRMATSPVLGSVGRGLLHSSPFPSSLGTSSLTFNLGSGLDNASSPIQPFSLDGMIPQYHARQTPFSGALNTNMSSFVMQQQPLNIRPLMQQQDFMTSTPYDKAMSLSMFPFEPNSTSLPGNSNLETPPHIHQSQPQERNILVGSPEETTNFMSTINRSFLHHRHDMKSEGKFPQALCQPSELSNMGAAINGGFQFIPFPGANEGVRPSLPPNPSIEFSSSSTNQLDHLPWLHKSPLSLIELSAPGEAYQQELDNTEAKIDDESFTGTTSEPKTLRWDLTLPSSDIDPTIDTKLRSDVAPVVEEASAMSFEGDFSHVAANLDGNPKAQ